MKSVLKIAFIVLLGSIIGCSKQEKPLYDQVMDIHDEVMPKMDDIEKIKRQLKDSIANNPEMPIGAKTEIEGSIAELEAARKSMMDWMHNFNPPEPTDKKVYEKFMESELVKVKKMREEVFTTLEKFKK